MLQKIGNIELSIVVPLYNEESNIDYLFERLTSVLNRIDLNYEILCVNDGSKDNTLGRLIEYHHQNSEIKVISLSRNYGKEIALTAGLDYAEGNAVIPIDADLQDPPELIPELVAKWREGYDVVLATRRRRHGESWLKRITANAFYQTIERISSVPIPRNTGDFRLVDRCVVDALKRMPERTRFMKGLFAWVGFKQTAVFMIAHHVIKEQRHGITGNCGTLPLMGLRLLVLSFKNLELHWSLCIHSSVLYAGYLVLRTLIFGIDIPGYASIMVAVLFLGGIQLISLGVIGEYLSRVYEEVKGRPLYLVREMHGFD